MSQNKKHIAMLKAPVNDDLTLNRQSYTGIHYAELQSIC